MDSKNLLSFVHHYVLLWKIQLLHTAKLRISTAEIISTMQWLELHWLTSNEFIAVKKIFAMKIHRNEEEKFIALSILAWFLLFFGFFHNFCSKKILILKRKNLFFVIFFLANFPLEKSLFFHRKFIAFIAMISKFPLLHRSEKKVQWISQYNGNIKKIPSMSYPIFIFTLSFLAFCQ